MIFRANLEKNLNIFRAVSEIPAAQVPTAAVGSGAELQDGKGAAPLKDAFFDS